MTIRPMQPRVHNHKTRIRERRVAVEFPRRCADCGLDIPREHLNEDPRATRCVVCELAHEAA